jgi:hypothetical protein
MQYTRIDKCAKNGRLEVANMEYLSSSATYNTCPDLITER